MSQPGFASIKIRLRQGDGYAMGPGKADLLEAIQETKSIAAAGRKLGLSYSKSRHLLDELNRDFESPLVIATKGGSSGGGSQLTEQGQQILVQFRSMEARAREAIAPLVEDFKKFMPGMSHRKAQQT